MKICKNCGSYLDPQEKCDCYSKNKQAYDIRPICFRCSESNKLLDLGFVKKKLLPAHKQEKCFICSRKTSINYNLEKVSKEERSIMRDLC